MIVMLTFAAVLGCGVMPPGQERTRNFTVEGFTLPVNMVYSTDASVRLKAFGVAATKEAVQSIVSRLVFDVLEQQGRNAFLPDAIISNILRELTVQIRYEPLECKDIEKDPTREFNGDKAKRPHCIIVGSTVTALCVGEGMSKSV
ncbi:hypothetical protein KIN20_003235 [Parelaphostrongylus tenuis]|uniref:Uncharacterized protein n=1 Tax=Parelaphostrongylus tenuis TaxID=148309 RepID=A0AAD5LZT9_PARTN|nr:hypothetical protein KIN20_003235 [Parelaphostrongylus tenuis]